MMPQAKQTASTSFEGAVNKVLDNYGLLSESVVCPNCNHVSRSDSVCTICSTEIPDNPEKQTTEPRTLKKME